MAICLKSCRLPNSEVSSGAASAPSVLGYTGRERQYTTRLGLLRNVQAGFLRSIRLRLDASLHF
eukprot:748386-Pleurochrysis_carterae.AAC.1